VEYIREAKQEGIAVTAQVTPHHLMMTEDDFVTYDTNFKMSPPLRSVEDQKAILEGLKDGTIDVIGSDHSPHAAEEKDMDVEVAPDGEVGLSSYFGAVMTVLYHGNKVPLAEIVRKMSLRPSEIIGKPKFGKLGEGELANFVLADLNHEWTFEPKLFVQNQKTLVFLAASLKGVCCIILLTVIITI
jgi:dihydroorotase